MCALLNFIKVFCIVLHILTFHSLRWSIYFPPFPNQPKGVAISGCRIHFFFFLLILATGKKLHPDYDFVHE